VEAGQPQMVPPARAPHIYFLECYITREEYLTHISRGYDGVDDFEQGSSHLTDGVGNFGQEAQISQTKENVQDIMTVVPCLHKIMK
jgi:hypothetical protein